MVLLHATYSLRRENLNKDFRFTVAELQEYHGQSILYGHTHEFSVKASLGLERNPERPSCFPLFLDQPDLEIDELRQALEGNPLYFYLGERPVPVLNVNHRPGMLRKESMLRRAAGLIDVWELWHRQPPPRRLPRDVVRKLHA